MVLREWKATKLQNIKINASFHATFVMTTIWVWWTQPLLPNAAGWVGFIHSKEINDDF